MRVPLGCMPIFKFATQIIYGLMVYQFCPHPKCGAHRNEGLNVLEHVVDVVDGETQRLGHAELPVVVLRKSF